MTNEVLELVQLREHISFLWDCILLDEGDDTLHSDSLYCEVSMIEKEMETILRAGL
jgi:hypothetical protein